MAVPGLTRKEYRFSTDETCIVVIACEVTTLVTKVMPNRILDRKVTLEDRVRTELFMFSAKLLERAPAGCNPHLIQRQSLGAICRSTET
jgi:hypothetical protein